MGCKEAGSLRLPVFWLCMWWCAGLGFALEDVDDDHIAATARADHPRLFRRDIYLGLVIGFWVWPLRHAKKRADGSNFFDARTAG